MGVTLILTSLHSLVSLAYFCPGSWFKLSKRAPDFALFRRSNRIRFRVTVLSRAPRKASMFWGILGGKTCLRVRARVGERFFIELKFPEQIASTAKIFSVGERFLEEMLPHLTSFIQCDPKNTETYRILSLALWVSRVPSDFPYLLIGNVFSMKRKKSWRWLFSHRSHEPIFHPNETKIHSGRRSRSSDAHGANEICAWPLFFLYFGVVETLVSLFMWMGWTKAENSMCVPLVPAAARNFD